MRCGGRGELHVMGRRWPPGRLGTVCLPGGGTDEPVPGDEGGQLSFVHLPGAFRAQRQDQVAASELASQTRISVLSGNSSPNSASTARGSRTARDR